ncbi:unnamed protein product, partial [Didymodactylos carnosus]
MSPEYRDQNEPRVSDPNLARKIRFRYMPSKEADPQMSEAIRLQYLLTKVKPTLKLEV